MKVSYKSGLIYLSVIAATAVLSGCGSSSSSSSTSTQNAAGQANAKLAFDQSIAGFWAAAQPSVDSYEFFMSTDDSPFVNTTKIGRVIHLGNVSDLFYWDFASDGTVLLKTVGLSCPVRPLSKCPVTGTISISAQGGNLQGSLWTVTKRGLDQSVGPTVVSDTFAKPNVSLSGLPTGDVYLTRAQQFAAPIPAHYNGQSLTIRFNDFGVPLELPVSVGNTTQTSLSVPAGQSSAVMTMDGFNVSGAGPQYVPVKAWFENVQVGANYNGGLIVSYEQHRQIQLPPGVSRSQIANADDYEKTAYVTKSFSIISTFAGKPAIKAGDHYTTLLPLDFDPSVTNLGAGNELNFTSATSGTLSHIDPYKGQYSETRNFTWTQASDGTLTMNFEIGVQVTARFVKAVNGGYQVLYAETIPGLGTSYVVHDFLDANHPIAFTDAMVPGRYSFVSSGLQTVDTVVLKADHTVSGAIGGYWFVDSNGDLVSYQCIDATGTSLSNYQACYDSFGNVSNMVFAHIRRLKLLANTNGNWSLDYVADAYGAPFGITGSTYLTAPLTYQWTRIGDN